MLISLLLQSTPDIKNHEIQKNLFFVREFFPTNLKCIFMYYKVLMLHHYTFVEENICHNSQ